MAALDEVRIQLEGGLERLESWAEDFAPVAKDLASGNWRGWLDARRHLWERLIANERELEPVLQKARRLAAASPPLARWLGKWDARRAAVFRTARKRHGVEGDGFAQLLAGLRNIPVPPVPEFDNRQSFFGWWFSRRHPRDGNSIFVTAETIGLNGRTHALRDVVSISIRRKGHQPSRITLGLKDGSNQNGQIPLDDEEAFVRALARLGVPFSRT